MKICIPTSDDQGLASTAAAHFGSAPFFTVIDLETDTVSAKANPSCGHSPSSCHHVNLLQAQRVDAVVCGGIGRRAVTALEEAGIQVLSAPEAGVAEIVDAVRGGRAPRLSIDAACAGHDHRPMGAGAASRHRHQHQRQHQHRHACGGGEEARS